MKNRDKQRETSGEQQSPKSEVRVTHCESQIGDFRSKCEQRNSKREDRES
jgi:hypothetical protein